MATVGYGRPVHSVTNEQQVVYDAASAAAAKAPGPVPVAPKAPSSNIEPKTVSKLQETPFQGQLAGVPKVKSASTVNVLNGFRSFNYNFTLAALPSDLSNDPESYRNSSLDFIILKSGGKGMSQMAAPDNLTEINKTLVNGFNKESPGKFDMFIDQVEIESLMLFTPASSLSQPTSIRFTVVEPYSINGLIEALHVSAVAAGHLSYSVATFLLKMEFVGYPDTDTDLGPSMPVPNSTRYFTFIFTGIEVNITEKGTTYKCTAVPNNEKGFGNANSLKEPVSMVGNTVKSILDSLMESVSKQVVLSDNTRTGKTNARHDTYAVKFPQLNTSASDSTVDNEIAQSTVADLLTENQLYHMVDQQNAPEPPTAAQKRADPEIGKYTPISTQVQFANGASILECIVSLIRDSNYVKQLLKTFTSNNNSSAVDEFGMVKYFLVKLEVLDSQDIDPISRKPYKAYTYVVTPFLIHYTMIPGYSTAQIDLAKITQRSIRDYNYIYTGKNVDIIDFKLNFNTLFFEAIPLAMAATSAPSLRNVAAAPATTNSVINPKTAEKNIELIQESSQPTASLQTGVASSDVHLNGTINSGQTTEDPYRLLAKNMHDAVINSRASMITGELNILGDPFFLVTGGIGNYRPKADTENIGVVGDAEADFTGGVVLITIKFRNPIDINTFEKGGSVYFQTNDIAFSGIYMVTKVISTFDSGKFQQRLEIIRVPGQLNNTEPAADLTVVHTEIDNPAAKSSTDTSLIKFGNSARASFDNMIVDSNPVNLFTTLGNGASNFAIPPQSGSLGGNIVNSINSIPGSLNTYASSIRTAGNNLLDLGTNFTNPLTAEITSGINSAKSLITSPAALANQFGILPETLQKLNPTVQRLVLTQMVNQKTPFDIPTGIPLQYVPDLSSIPAAAPFISAPLPDYDQQFLSKLAAANGTAAVAAAFGTRSLDNIPGGISAATLSEIMPSAPRISASFSSLTSAVTSAISDANAQYTSLITANPAVLTITSLIKKI